MTAAEKEDPRALLAKMEAERNAAQEKAKKAEEEYEMKSKELLSKLRADDLAPDGHFKFPHLWPVKFPQAGRLNYQLFGLAGSGFLSW